MIHSQRKWILSLVSLTLCTCVLAHKTFASDLQSQTTAGTGTVTEMVSYNGDTEATEDENSKAKWNWDFSYTYSAIKLGATTSTATATSGVAANNTDHTNSVTAGFGFEDRWSAGLDLNYSKTSEENLSSFGPSIHLGYTFDLATPKKAPIKKVKPVSGATKTAAKKKDEEEEDKEFIPTLNFVVTLGSTKYTQDFTTTVRAGSKRKAAVTKAGSQSIVQKSGEIAATLTPYEWVDLELSLTGYNYNRDVGTFINNLDDPRSIRSGAASFGSTLAGFSHNDAAIDLTFHLPMDIDFTGDLSRSVSESDGSRVNTFKLDLSKLWADTWKTGIGFERDKSDTDTQNLGIFTLSYQF